MYQNFIHLTVREEYVLPNTSVLPSPWKSSYLENSNRIKKKIFITHPIHRFILDTWVEYKNARIIETSKMIAATTPFKMPTFRSQLLVNSEKFREKILQGLVFCF